MRLRAFLAGLAQRALDAWVDVRLVLWRYGVKLPAKQDWQARIQKVVRNGGVYVGEGVVGAPIQWSLLMVGPSGKLEPLETTCASTGVRIGPHAPVTRDGARDFTHFGVRCARCGIPLHCKAAGMAHTLAIPACEPCRKDVKKIELEG